MPLNARHSVWFFALAALAAVLAAAPRAAAQAKLLFDVYGHVPEQHFGFSVGGAGDVDGDGVPDLIVGEQNAGGVDPPAHAVRILSGVDGSVLQNFFYESKSGTAVAGLGDIDGDGRSDVVVGQPGQQRLDVRSGSSGDVLFSGNAGVPLFGWSVNPAGDVNADGITDVVVGSGVGGLWDYGGDMLRLYSGADGALLHEIDEFDIAEYPKSIGWSVAGLGDVNGDGLSDVVSGIPMFNGWIGGKLVIYSGADLAPLHTIGGGHGLGWSVANAGDFDGDGVNDVAATTMLAEDFAAVYSGATGAQLLLLDDIPGEGNSDLDIDGIGDIDGDGHPDLVVARVGAVLFYSGDDGRLLMSYDQLTDDGTGGGLIGNVAVASAGDLDGDGRDDVVVGNHRDDTLGADAGRIVVISSKPQPWTDLGQGLPGAGGPPQLSGAGTLASGSPGQLRLLGAAPGAPGVLFVGATLLKAPFKGGTLVPAPNLMLNYTTSPTGSYLLSWAHWPAGLPGFTKLCFQAWTADPTAAPAGASASNALLATTPP